MGSAKFSDLGWPFKVQDEMLNIRYGHVLTLIMHNISIPVNGSKLLG